MDSNGTAPDSGAGGSSSSSRKASSSLAFLTFFKSLFGAGLLALPSGLGHVGLPLGALIYATVAVACAFSCHLLLRAREAAREGAGGYNLHDCAGELADADTDVDIGVFVAPADKARQSFPCHLVTYGDLSDLLLGPVMATVTRWTIISLNILFTAGLVIVICENLGGYLSDRYGGDDGEEDDDVMAYRRAVGLVLLPIVSLLVQITWLQDMWTVSALGLAVYSIGVVGSTLYSAIGTIRASDSQVSSYQYSDQSGSELYTGSSGRMPTDLWEFGWDGVGAFLGSAVYALEGINLALPTVHSMRTPSEGTEVVCSAILLYGAVTLTFAAVGYAGGLGGGPGTGRTQEECDVVTGCLQPPSLRATLQLALSAAMVLSIPVMLYPSTEMLEVMLTDWRAGKRRGIERKNPTGRHRAGRHRGSDTPLMEITAPGATYAGTRGEVGGSPGNKLSEESIASGSVSDIGDDAGRVGIILHPPRDSYEVQQKRSHQRDGINTAAFSQKKSWKLRLFLALMTVILGTALSRSFARFSGLVGSVGLSFAGFVLPPLLYYRAMERLERSVSRSMLVGMVILAIFGVYNIVVGGASSLAQLFG